MAVLPIVTLPDPRLKERSLAVTEFGLKLELFVKDMHDSMIAAQGIGLAAVQVGFHQRVIVLDLGDLDEDEEYIEGDEDSERRLAQKKSSSVLEVYINPEIIASQGECEYEEGCLSVPGVRSMVHRKEQITVRYQDTHGKFHEIVARGLRAIALQHEIDHCDGIVFTDRLGPMQRMVVLKRYQKLQEEKIRG